MLIFLWSCPSNLTVPNKCFSDLLNTLKLCWCFRLSQCRARQLNFKSRFETGLTCASMNVVGKICRNTLFVLSLRKNPARNIQPAIIFGGALITPCLIKVLGTSHTDCVIVQYPTQMIEERVGLSVVKAWWSIFSDTKYVNVVVFLDCSTCLSKLMETDW